jgi:hypothetical protein
MADETNVTPTPVDVTPLPVEKAVWWKNAQLWSNVIGVAALVATNYFGVVIDPKLQAGIIAIINAVFIVPKTTLTQSAADEHNKNVRSIVRSRMMK